LTKPALKLDLMRPISLLFILLCLICSSVTDARPKEVVLQSGEWQVGIVPETLEIRAYLKDNEAVTLAAPAWQNGEMPHVQRNGRELTIIYVKRGLTFFFKLDGPRLDVSCRAGMPGTLRWPTITWSKRCKGLILPLWEGSYVPPGDETWQQFLEQRSPISSTDGLSMPFIGFDMGSNTLTCILITQFNNDISFKKRGEGLDISISHTFKRNWSRKEFRFCVILGDSSPIAPAREFRKHLVKNGEFVTLREKAASVPGAAKLAGAPHAYLWGMEPIHSDDILDWRHFARTLMAGDKSSIRRIWNSLDDDTRDAVKSIAASPQGYTQMQVTGKLNSILQGKILTTPAIVNEVELAGEGRALLSRDAVTLKDGERIRLNCLILASLFPGDFRDVRSWGWGSSLKSVEKLRELGFDRFVLILDSWRGGFWHPEAVEKAKELGYLIGPYDSYHSIHSPGEADTWETAQFDGELYEYGAVVNEDGKKSPGFMKKGYHISPLITGPYVKKRLDWVYGNSPFNAWFIDCDAYGELFDDFSLLHPATQEDDMKARLARMSFIRDSHGLVIGSEGGAAYAAPVIHFAHGMMTQGLGWGDAEMEKDRSSPFYRGRYYPEEGPEAFIKPVPLKEEYYHLYYDPLYRLPLYEAVFHDSVVNTHHYACGSLKFTNARAVNELSELLYCVPPMYHLNPAELEKNGTLIKRHYEFFSPLHRELAYEPLTDFQWLTPDRLVQKTTFANGTEMIANFRGLPFYYAGTMISPLSIMAKRQADEKGMIFTAGSKLP